MFEVSDVLVKKNIRRDTELYIEAQTRKEGGQTELGPFVVSHSTKSLNYLIVNTKNMHTAKATTQREKMTILDMTKKCLKRVR